MARVEDLHGYGEQWLLWVSSQSESGGWTSQQIFTLDEYKKALGYYAANCCHQNGSPLRVELVLEYHEICPIGRDVGGDRAVLFRWVKGDPLPGSVAWRMVNGV